MNSSNWFTFFVLCTSFTFGFSKIRSACLINQMAVFSEISMEERPSTITSLVHIVACHKVLWGKFRNILAILELKSRFNNLGEWDCVARSAWALVTDWACEVKSFEVCEIIWFWKLWVWDIIGMGVFFSVWLSFFKSFFEFCWVVSEFCFGFNFSFGLSLCFSLSFTLNLLL